MPADVNVTEKVARAIHGAINAHLHDRPTLLINDTRAWRVDNLAARCTEAALSALADPDVLAGIAGVVANFTIEVRTGRGVVVASIGPEQGALLTAAVVEWLRGRAL